MLIYTCPKCGSDLIPYTIATYPPIHAYRCFKCGWRHEEPQDQIVRIPFKDDREISQGTKTVSVETLDNCINDCFIVTDEAKIRIGLEETW